MSNNRETKLLLSCCVHGDEWLGKHISDNYPVGKNEHFMWRSIIANPEAMYLNVRFIDTDLNRAFPGKPDGNYEERRAYQINKILPQYDLVLDWHQSESEMDDIIFVHKLTPYLKEVCQHFDIQHILELEQGNGHYEGLLFRQVDNGMGLEYGHLYNFDDACERAERDLNNLLDKRVVNQNFHRYRIFQNLSVEWESKVELKNFQKLTLEERKILGIEEDNIYPCFINSYSESNIYCVLLQKIN